MVHHVRVILLAAVLVGISGLVPSTRFHGHGRSLTPSPVWHRCLVVPHQQPLVPAPALFAPEPPPDVQEQHIPPTPIGERLMVQRDAAIAHLTERPEGEGAVI